MWLIFFCFQRHEYIFSILDEQTDSLLLGLHLSENRLNFLVTAPGSKRRNRLSLNDVALVDDHWHTVVLSVTGPYSTLTVDCGLPLEM